MTETTRRTVMLGAGSAGLAAVLTACASYGSPTTEADVEPPAADEPSSEAPKKKSEAKPKALANTSDIPEGGGKVFKNQKIVVTQPTAGEYKAFSAVCTHQGCTVDEVADTINCPCHGSAFSITDGSVANGPATEPLEEKQIEVDGEKIRLA
ncbi:Rieske (2Fe-2S) protein [Nonomuraea gerenzanensis]|uniref:Cytochrome bc1 complex Rieske iron-sulfur subunit n=2 Tax=Nonomuraea gerenzanensis TaxID=93944 RepID=A0A1M4EI38_9ACTN|nr:Rieske (2Fe-2S) protein [Nonomuraea gerenzanensis]UBU19003.1 Rieske (2Fe-2S) protein [Nonomuraea gerenzanensis]SBO98233.1 iron sulphur protein [Nonomuraea gerenzanensis]